MTDLEHVVNQLVSAIRRDTGPGFMTPADALYVVRRIRLELEVEAVHLMSKISKERENGR